MNRARRRVADASNAKVVPQQRTIDGENTSHLGADRHAGRLGQDRQEHRRHHYSIKGTAREWEKCVSIGVDRRRLVSAFVERAKSVEKQIHAYDEIDVEAGRQQCEASASEIENAAQLPLGFVRRGDHHAQQTAKREAVLAWRSRERLRRAAGARNLSGTTRPGLSGPWVLYSSTHGRCLSCRSVKPTVICRGARLLQTPTIAFRPRSESRSAALVRVCREAA